MSIKLKKPQYSVSCDEFNEYTEGNYHARPAFENQKYPFEKNNNVYTIHERGFIESNNSSISFDRTNKILTAKSLEEEGEKSIPLGAIIPEFEIINNKFYITENTVQAIQAHNITISQLELKILVKHSTFSRGKYRKATRKRPLRSREWDSEDENGTKEKWSDLRGNDEISPYQMSSTVINGNGKEISYRGYQHSGPQFRKHEHDRRNYKRYRLLSTPEKYEYNDDFFKTLYIKNNREVVFTTDSDNAENVYSYFRDHKMSNEDCKLGASPWLKYAFSVRTNDKTYSFQHSKLFTITYNATKSNHYMKSITL